MQEIFEYVAEPLRALVTSGDVSAEAAELFLGFLAVAVPVLCLVFFMWATYALLAGFLGLAGGVNK